MNSFDARQLRVGCQTYTWEMLGDAWRGGPDDLIAAAEAVDRFAAESTAAGVAIYDVALLRLRAVVARACGNENEYREYVDRYRAMAREFDFDGHIAMAESMLAQGSDSLH